MSLEFRKNHINEEISHSKCHFFYHGICTRILCLHILANQRKLHQKSANIFWPIRGDNRMRKYDNEIIIVYLYVNITNFDILKTQRLFPKRMYSSIKILFFYQSVPLRGMERIRVRRRSNFYFSVIQRVHQVRDCHCYLSRFRYPPSPHSYILALGP